MDKAQCRPPFLWFQMKENGRIWLTKAVQYASFIMRHGDAALDAASDSVRPLTTNGCDESRLMANWLKGQKWKSNAFW